MFLKVFAEDLQNSLPANFKMFERVPVFRLAFLLLALATYGVQVIGEEEALGVTEGEKETRAGETTARDSSNSDNWIESLTWNLLGYATIIIPGAFIIRMLKNSNFNERSGKLFVYAHVY